MGSNEKNLSNDEIGRYSRQMILPELGMKGQLKLKNSSALVVGLGGLGSPAVMFLAASGAGKLGLVDYDSVELSNLHRQVIHSEKSLGISKAESAKLFIKNLNSNVEIEVFAEPFTTCNALDIVKKFDVILDCTDNAATRYLLNDAAVLCGKPLVSGSALRFEGQLTTYNYQEGPCYRCIFPVPPPPQFVTNCSDGGVLGAIPGTIGSLQALEAVKVMSGIGSSYAGKMLLFDGLQGNFTQVTLRPKQANCSVCGNNPTITNLLEDYPTFCGGAGYDDKDKGIELLTKDDRISPNEFNKMLKSSAKHILLDVREPQELGICSLPTDSKNTPYSQMNSEFVMTSLGEYFSQQLNIMPKNESEKVPIVVVCRRGNDSQRAVKLLQNKFSHLPVMFKDIEGGLHQWAKEVDKTFPVY